MPLARLPRSTRAHARYLWVLLRRFRTTFVFLFTLLFGSAVLILWLYEVGGRQVGFLKALAASYFLMLGQPSLELPDSLPLTILFMALPPLAMVGVADGLIRFAYLFFAKQRRDKEWFAVQAETLSDHVIVCGAGRVGFRVLEQLLRLGIQAVVIERKEDAPFVGTLRGAGLPLLVEDVRSQQALEQANVGRARAVVCATDDDLCNLNIALDARRLNPGVRVVMRLFDDDLVAKMKQVLGVEAFSTSALAAPAFAAAALDPAVRYSFEVGGVHMVLWEVVIGARLDGNSVAQLRDEHGVLVVHLTCADGRDQIAPPGTEVLGAGDRVMLQAPLAAYRALRAANGSAEQ